MFFVFGEAGGYFEKALGINCLILLMLNLAPGGVFEFCSLSPGTALSKLPES